jgi:hypothetical protein
VLDLSIAFGAIGSLQKQTGPLNIQFSLILPHCVREPGYPASVIRMSLIRDCPRRNTCSRHLSTPQPLATLATGTASTRLLTSTTRPKRTAGRRLDRRFPRCAKFMPESAPRDRQDHPLASCSDSDFSRPLAEPVTSLINGRTRDPARHQAQGRRLPRVARGPPARAHRSLGSECRQQDSRW